MITVKRKPREQYNRVVYEHFGSFLSYKFIDLTPDSIAKALTTELYPKFQAGPWKADK